MPIIKVTKADLMKTVNLEPGWYGAQIVKVHPLEKATKGNSINHKFDAEVEGTNKVITITFNSQLIGKIAPLWKAITGKEVSEEFDTDELMGKKFDGKVGQRMYNDVMYDDFQAFLPYGTSKGMTGVF